MMVFLDHLIIFPGCVCIIYALCKSYPVRRQQRLGFVLRLAIPDGAFAVSCSALLIKIPQVRLNGYPR